MTDHAKCRHARFDWPTSTAWHCVVCGEYLGTGVGSPFAMRTGIELRPKLHDGLPTYGLGDRARLRGQPSRTASRRSSRMLTGGVKGESYVYCPRVGCGAGQHIDPHRSSQALLDSP